MDQANGTMDQANATLEVKRIHSMLRRNVKSAGNADVIWQDHKANIGDLERYSNAMVSLANIWQKSQPLNENRVEWCMKICREYFWDGGLLSHLEKDLRKVYYDSLKTGGIQSMHSLESFLAENTKYADFAECFCDRRLNLLDVGSCYNPFSKFDDEIAVVPMDLYPAINEVFQGDFLELEIIDKGLNGSISKDAFLDISPSSIKQKNMLLQGETVVDEGETEKKDTLENTKCTNGCLGSIQSSREQHCLLSTNNRVHLVDQYKEYLENPLRRLPRESFDVLVFSLVLSYLPTQKQRWDCCVKANRLLQDNGLLILIESDSAHQNRNAHQIQAWKHALLGIGFVRYRYSKLTHLHCMAFRKKTNVDFLIKQSKFTDNSTLMFIPQDFHEELDETEEGTFSIRTDEDNKEICDMFHLLPESM